LTFVGQTLRLIGVKTVRPVPASQAILEKIEDAHGIEFSEIEELFRRPHVVLRGSLDQYAERRYVSLGQTAAGRYLMVVYTLVPETGLAKVITARDMVDRERRFYRRTSGGKRHR